MNIDYIKSLLKRKNYTFQDLADKLGVDRANLYKSITSGNPTLERIRKIAQILEVPTSELFKGDENLINGYLEYNGTIYKVSSLRDITTFIENIGNKNQKI